MTKLCKECHVIEATHGDLCHVCYYGDNVGRACDPGGCTYDGCSNNPSITVEKLKAVVDEGRRITEEHLAGMGLGLLAGGIHLIPCDLLMDDQFVVSRAMYEAVKRAAGGAE